MHVRNRKSYRRSKGKSLDEKQYNTIDDKFKYFLHQEKAKSVKSSGEKQDWMSKLSYVTRLPREQAKTIKKRQII